MFTLRSCAAMSSQSSRFYANLHLTAQVFAVILIGAVRSCRSEDVNKSAGILPIGRCHNSVAVNSGVTWGRVTWVHGKFYDKTMSTVQYSNNIAVM